MDPLVGTVVGDRYKVIERLGAGGMATVYRGEHQLLRKGVAIKILLPEVAVDHDMATRFEAEAVAAARLDHPNCVGISDFGRTPAGQLYLVMELIDGRPLADFVGNGHRIPWQRAVEIARQVLRGLSRAHELGIVHRDLKPANIMISQRQAGFEIAKIIDFGIAKMIGDSAVGPSVQTKAGTVFGTADFLAPERLIGKGDNDPRSDLYSVGVMLYEMVVGWRPFHADDAMAIIKRAISEAPRPPSQASPDAEIPPALERAILKALAKEPDDRFASGREFLDALDVEELRTSAHPVVVAATRAFEVEQFRDKQVAGRRKRGLWLAGGAAAVVTIIAVASILGGGNDSGAAPFAPGVLPGGIASPRDKGVPDAGPRREVTEEIDRLVAQAGDADTVALRESAADRLLALGYADRIPRAKKLAKDLHQRATCPDRLEALTQLEKLKDPATLTAVSAAAARPDNGCLKERADKLATALDKLANPPPTPPPSTTTPAPAAKKKRPAASKSPKKGGHF